MRKTGYRIATGIVAALGTLILLLLLFFAGPLTDLLVGQAENGNSAVNPEEMGESCLILRQRERTFDGNGLFDPMEGVEALDADGSDIRYKVAVAYLTAGQIREKEIRYTVYNANRVKLTESCRLTLKNYEGPQIVLESPEQITWEELQRVTQVWKERGYLKGYDGFGKDITSAVVCSYRLDEGKQSAELTFSLTNAFNDSHMVTVEVDVLDMPSMQ